MNQSPMNQQPQTPMGQGQPAVSKGLLVTLIIVILIGGGFFAWYFLMGPGKKVASSTATTTTTPAATTTTPSTTTTTTTTTPTTTATADWKTYTNTRVAYSFEYPKTGLELALDETIKYPSTSAADSKTEDLVSFATSTLAYSVQTSVGVSEADIVAWIKDTNVSHASSDLTKYTKTTIGGKTAYTFTGELLSYVMNGKNVYIIKAMKGVAPSSDTTDATYKHLLSTFTFTK